jgi:hypothetical protein
MAGKKLPLHFWIGLILTLISWYLNWSLEGLRTHWGFFPLWLGFSLTVDGIVYFRKKTSLLKRNKLFFILLFVISAPAWWLFEFFNVFMQNWFYNGREYFSDLEYFLLASLSFSTVMPAVFGMAELAGTFKWIQKLSKWKSIEPSNKNLIRFLIIGILLVIGITTIPDYTYPFVWIAVYFIIEPINVKLKNRNLFTYLKDGDWRPLIALSIGCLMTAFFWEMWNINSYPKWVYELPWVDFLDVFEMPILGYIGYIPFSWELFALFHLLAGILGIGNISGYIKLIPDDDNNS